MKIYGINQLGNIKTEKTLQKNSNVKNPISKNQTEISKNSLAEAIGRSQVSFKGTSSLEGNLLEYQNASLLKGSENFVYNKEDGSIEYEEYTSGNILKKRYKFNPLKGIEQVTLLQPDGTTTVEKKEPDLYVFERYDSEGKILLREEADDDSEESMLDKVSVKFEYGDKQREIIRRYKNGEVSEVEVVDSRTGEVVTEGRLLESKFRREGGWIITKNIVTGDIYEKERQNQYGDRIHYEEYSRKTLALIHSFTTDSKTGETSETKYTDDGKNILFTENKSVQGNILYSAEYSPNTLKLVKEVEFDAKNNAVITKEFTEDGIIQKKTVAAKNGSTEVATYDKKGNISNVTVTSKNKREVDSYDYDEYGKIIKDVHIEYKRNGQVLSLTDYIPNTGIIKTKTDYKTEDTYIEYTYCTDSEEKNVPKSADEYEYGVLISEKQYYEEGYVTQRTYCTDKAVPYEFEKYNENGIIIKRVKDRNSMNLRETTLYDERTGNRTRFTQRTKDGKPLLQIDYYQNGKAIKIEREFNSDGSYKRTEYDEYGNVISITNHEAKTQYTYSSQQTEMNNKKQKTKEEHIASLAKEIGKPWIDVLPANPAEANCYFAKSKISKDEMDAILDITGFSSPDELFAMNKKQYRTLVKQFHTGQYKEEEEKEHQFEKDVFNIISQIYSNSPNEGV